MQYELIKEFLGIDTLSESSDVGKNRLRKADNLILRPVGGFKRIPTYDRLWGMLNLSNYNTALGLTSGSATCLLRIQNEGKIILAFWDVANSKTLGLAYAGDTGSFPGDVTLTGGTATIDVLRTGLQPDRRWYSYRFHDQVWMGNGVDPNMIYQHDRSGLQLRTAGINSVPAAPTLSAVTVGTGSVGWANVVREIGLTYFDAGVNGMGYETGMSATASITLGTSAQDIKVTVTGNTTGELSRFGYIRIYMLLPSGGIQKWMRLAQVANASADHVLGTDLEISGTYEMSQLRTAPCTMFELFRGRMWCAGNVSYPSRVWVSKYALKDELVPEGSDPDFYLAISGRSDEPDTPEISAMLALNERDIHIATQKTITAVDGTSYARNMLSRVITGPVNPSCISLWNNGSVPYVGRDGLLYVFRGVTFGEGDFLAGRAVSAMRAVADVGKLSRQPWRANMMPDPVNNMLWMWVPDENDVLRGFVYDFLSHGLAGPFDWPKLLSVAKVGVTDGRFVGCDETGNLFVFDTEEDATQDVYPTSPAFTFQSASYTPPATHDGYGTVTLTAGKLLKAANTVWETPFMDLGAPHTRKGYYCLEWTTLRNSRGLMVIVLTSDLGHSKTIEYGEVYGRERHKVAFGISGHALKITFTVTTAEDAPFGIRDLTIGWQSQGAK